MGKLSVMMTALAVMVMLPIFNSPAHAAFSKINVNGKQVSNTTTVDNGIFADMNTILMVGLGIGGFVVIACIIFAGAKLATAQGNPQARTQGFIGLGMAFIGGWVVYKCLEIAGWIKGFGSTPEAATKTGMILPPHDLMQTAAAFITPFV